MSDWPERELARELARQLAPVVAPHILKIRLGFAPAKRSVFPRVALAVAAAVLIVIGGGYAASRTPALELRGEAGVTLRLSQAVPPAGAPLLRCDGGAGMRPQVNPGKATVLLAHAASPVEAPGHVLAAAPDAGCHLCHSL